MTLENNYAENLYFASLTNIHVYDIHPYITEARV